LKTIRVDTIGSPDELDELEDRLIKEAQAAGKLSHPNIVTIYDVGKEGDLYYIAMEYLQGYTLEKMIQKKSELNYKLVAKIMIQACQALSYAHEKGIVHRDIKPANIMILDNFDIKVMDFGIARFGGSSMTQTGLAMGTPSYIAPEVLQGKRADKRSDIFSLGVVLYEILVGQKPFKGESISALIYCILNDQPPMPSTINDKTPTLFDRVVGKALVKNPEERFQNALEMETQLKEFVASFVVTRSFRI
jgi:serine/threonine-protein kinase